MESITQADKNKYKILLVELNSIINYIIIKILDTENTSVSK